MTRAMHALADLAPHLDRRTVGEAAGERSDAAALLRVLETAALDPLRQGDPLADARLRWIRDRERLLQAEGGVLSSHEVAALLGVTRQAVAKARAEGRLVGLPIGRGRYVYPAWQFGPAGPLPGLRAVREALGEEDPWTLAAFLLAPNARLGDDAPLAVLERGEVDAAVRAAQACGEQGAA